MIRPTWRTPILVTLAPLFLIGCRPSAPEDAAESTPPEPGSEVVPSAPSEASAPPRATLPGLFTIMAGLQQDMAGLDRGLWREDFDSIGARATAIADHPLVPATEAQAVAGVLGPDMAAFKQWDTEVHDLAVRIRELAAARDLDAILAAKADLDRGCVGCHTRFRTRLREGLR